VESALDSAFRTSVYASLNGEGEGSVNVRPGCKQPDELAIFGGRPLFEEKLHVGRPNIGDRDRFLACVNDILDSRWLTNKGRYVDRFEREIEALLGLKHCIAMCNGTVALEIAVRALDLSGEVILPSFTFIACAHALQWQRIKPVFCDVDPATHNIDPARAADMITPRTTGIMGVHLWGQACDTDALAALAREHGLKVLYDASHAFACSHGGRMIGGFGDAAVFSFHATKFINTLEGGAVVTDNDELAAKIRLMKNFGFSGMDNVIYIGTNGKMNEISAAMGLSGIGCLEDIVAVNRRNYEAYQRGLANVPGLTVLRYDARERQNYQYVVTEIEETESGLSRDRLLEILHAESVIARRYFYPGCHRMEPYRTLQPEAGSALPETERLCARVMCLPTGTAVGESDIDKICALIASAVDRSSEINRRFQAHA